MKQNIAALLLLLLVGSATVESVATEQQGPQNRKHEAVFETDVSKRSRKLQQQRQQTFSTTGRGESTNNFDSSFAAAAAAVANDKVRSAATNLRQRHAQARIVGGDDVSDPSAYPFFGFPGSKQCGATLIAPRIMLAAAHCANAYEGGYMDIGTTLYDGTDSVERIPVLRELTHPQFNPVLFEYDVMLLLLDRDVTSIVPAVVNRERAVPEIDDALKIIGFGTTEFGFPSLQLRQVDQYVVDNDTCNTSYNNGIFSDLVSRNKIPDDIMICAGTIDASACSGDSGGPLLATNDDGTQTIVGIVSFGSEFCIDAPAGLPGVYTRVSAMADFIDAGSCFLALASTESTTIDTSDCPSLRALQNTWFSESSYQLVSDPQGYIGVQDSLLTDASQEQCTEITDTSLYPATATTPRSTTVHCGVTLIARDVAITSLLCFQVNEISNAMYVNVGGVKAEGGDAVHRLPVIDFIINPNSNRSVLLLLDIRAVDDDALQPTPYSTNRYDTGNDKDVTVVGYSGSDFDLQQNPTLLAGTLQLVDNSNDDDFERCYNNVGRDIFIDDVYETLNEARQTFFCVEYDDDSTPACRGDLVGSAVYNTNNVMIGYSECAGACTGPNASIYTRLSVLKDFIEVGLCYLESIDSTGCSGYDTLFYDEFFTDENLRSPTTPSPTTEIPPTPSPSLNTVDSLFVPSTSDCDVLCQTIALVVDFIDSIVIAFSLK